MGKTWVKHPLTPSLIFPLSCSWFQAMGWILHFFGINLGLFWCISWSILLSMCKKNLNWPDRFYIYISLTPPSTSTVHCIAMCKKHCSGSYRLLLHFDLNVNRSEGVWIQNVVHMPAVLFWGCAGYYTTKFYDSALGFPDLYLLPDKQARLSSCLGGTKEQAKSKSHIFLSF